MSEPPPPGAAEVAADAPAQALTPGDAVLREGEAPAEPLLPAGQEPRPPDGRALTEPLLPAGQEPRPPESGRALTSEAIEAVLSDFRSWLRALPAGASLPSAPREEGPDLHTLLGQFVAVRHEVNLQTRATRAQQEQTGVALEQLAQALGALRQAESAGRAAQQASEEERLRPLLKTLVDLYDALALAGREVQRMQSSLATLLEQMTPAAAGAAEAALPEPPPVAARSWWQRLFGAGPRDSAALRHEVARLRSELLEERRRRLEDAIRVLAAANRVRQAVASLVMGYGMGLQRIERALGQHGLEAIAAVGEPFDPESMEVVDVITDSGRPSGEVVEEVRRGYLWNDRVFRYAQVRVAKNA